jgi:hypothetical protein
MPFLSHIPDLWWTLKKLPWSLFMLLQLLAWNMHYLIARIWGLLVLLGTYSCFSNWKIEENVKLPQVFLMCKSDKKYLMNECGVLLNLNTTKNFSRNLKTKQ